jgi:hypothetical protein
VILPPIEAAPMILDTSSFKIEKPSLPLRWVFGGVGLVALFIMVRVFSSGGPAQAAPAMAAALPAATVAAPPPIAAPAPAPAAAPIAKAAPAVKAAPVAKPAPVAPAPVAAKPIAAKPIAGTKVASNVSPSVRALFGGGGKAPKAKPVKARKFAKRR